MITIEQAEIAEASGFEVYTPNRDVADIERVEVRKGAAGALVCVGNPLSDHFGVNPWYPLTELELTAQAAKMVADYELGRETLRELAPFAGKRVRVSGPGGYRDETIHEVDLQAWTITRTVDGEAGQTRTEREAVLGYCGYAVTERL